MSYEGPGGRILQTNCQQRFPVFWLVATAEILYLVPSLGQGVTDLEALPGGIGRMVYTLQGRALTGKRG